MQHPAGQLGLGGEWRVIRDAGRIVAISSSSIRLAVPGSPPDAATKAALVGLIRSIAAEVAADGVTANVVTPGLTATAAPLGSVAPFFEPVVAGQLIRCRLEAVDVVPGRRLPLLTRDAHGLGSGPQHRRWRSDALMTASGARWICFTEEQGRTVEALCEAVVPGSAPAGPALYLDSVATDMPPPQLEALLECIDDVSGALSAGLTWDDVAARPYFGWLRALSIEAYYSDFRQPGYTGPGAWDTIGFSAAPMAARAKQDWTFLRLFTSREQLP